MISNAALNACLNGLSGVLLACGYAAIRAGKKGLQDRKSTRLNSSHGYISYAVFCLKKKKPQHEPPGSRVWRDATSGRNNLPISPRNMKLISYITLRGMTCDCHL